MRAAAAADLGAGTARARSIARRSEESIQVRAKEGGGGRGRKGRAAPHGDACVDERVAVAVAGSGRRSPSAHSVCSSFAALGLLRSCRICEDVAQTYHDAYRCAGENVDLWGPGNTPGFPACDQALFTCDKLTGDIAEACRHMEAEFIDDEAQMRVLWMSQMEFGKAYETCVKLDKCDADPQPDPEDQVLTECHKVFNSPLGQHNMLHPEFTVSCTEECYLCTWLVREWPMFQEICTPPGTSMKNSIDPDRETIRLEAIASINKAERLQKLRQGKVEDDDDEGVSFVQHRARQWGSAQSQPQRAARSQLSDAAIMSQRHRSYNHFLAERNAATVDEASVDEAGDVFLESGVEVRASAGGMARAWSKHTQRAIQQTLQSQAADHSAAPASVYGANKDLQYSLIRSDTDDTMGGPQLGGTDLSADCFSMWRYFQRSRKAKFFSSWKRRIGIEITPADVARSNLWDANIVCKCLGQCDLDPFEHLGLIKQCRYDDRDRIAMEYVFPQPH